MNEYWTSFGSLLGVLAFCQSLLQVIFPPELRFASLKFLARIFNGFCTYCYFDITEIDGVSTNELYNAVQLYLSSFVNVQGSRLSLTRPLNSSATTFGLSNNDTIVDSFNGVTVQWEHVVTQRQPQTLSWRPLPDEKRGFTLRIKRKDRDVILESYLDHIMDKASEIRRKNQERLLFTNARGGSLDSRGHPWESVPFKHPSTFDTLAMSPSFKREIMNDLKDFTEGQVFYQRTGRAWKRGYLLYGPPGTGKSSLIAAMANYLNYDIYDLELTEVNSNSELRKLLMKTSSKSIIVIEDIDCSLNLTNRRKDGNGGGGGSCGRSYYDPGPPPDMRGEGCRGNNNTITLSGLLNFTDGLWSCCGSERIFVFTTNHVEKLDPALLRSGRMDMHIYMSYCSFDALRILLKNYLGFDEEEEEGGVLKEIEGIIDKAKMTPADVSEVLIKNRRDKVKAVRELLEALKVKAQRKDKNGGGGGGGGGGLLRDESNGVLCDFIEDEEQEKRALESPKAGSDFEEDVDDCKKAN